MNTPEQLADAQHPWIGLASFTEGNREFFAGRGGEIDDLLRLVRRESLTLLYGVSGLGKTSLLQAGLFPALRAEKTLPVPIRLDYLEDAPSLSAQVFGAITAAAVASGVESAVPLPGGTLWEYFHREGNHFWSARNELVTPCLVFDQFEEFFTLGRETPARAARAAAFIRELADLVENRPPAALRGDPVRAGEYSFQPAPLKVLISMREDYLADLDRIRAHFRALGQNHLRLLPMGEAQARQVIGLGAALFTPEVGERIVRFVAGRAADPGAEITVAPALLSLVLRELNERRLARGPEAKITPDLLDLEQDKIFEDFYLRSVRDFPEGVRTFIEDELLTTSGHRNSCALDDALTRPEVTLPVLNELVNRRLLAFEDRRNTRRIELTHDVLIPVIKASRDTRLTREAMAQAERLRIEQRAQRRKQRATAAVAWGLAVILLATLCGGYYVFVREHRLYYREWVRQHGFPVGVGRISEMEARRLPVSMRLVHKGVRRDGWKLRWKPVFRMEAVNGLLELTTSHGNLTYLWKGDFESTESQDDKPQEKGERLGLRTVCQWEFVATAEGEILYERALNRDGRMVYGLIYSPPGTGPAATRLARFVGPDGFPQLQRRSAAEYVLIHYDENGWEDRITYRDGKNLPAAGPDGAFGQSLSHNHRGQLTRVLSLDADGQNMIDHAGNCGMEMQYDENGQVKEHRSLGPDLQPMPVTLGYVIAREQYDKFGRNCRETYHDASGEPVLHTEGFHGWEQQYDGRGNATASTYLGLDGAPTLLAVGYAIVRSSYDARGWVTRQTFHGINGEPRTHTDGHHGWEAQYDGHGNQLVLTYLGLDGKPALLAKGGYAIFRRDYEEHGWVIRTSFHGVRDEPVAHSDGHHGWQAHYDGSGNQIKVIYFGLDGKPALRSDGFAIFRSKYDSDGNQLGSAYFDAEDKPVLHDGMHRIVSVYDARGKRTRANYYGIDGKPILHKEGYYGWEARYDGRGNRTLLTYLGSDGNPNALSRGYAMQRSEYDARGKEIRRTFHGIAAEPVMLKDGYHGWEAEYDERGRQTTRAYLGLDGSPNALPSGYAIQRSTYDARGREIRRTFHGITAEPVLLKEGHHGWLEEYDARGNLTMKAFIGLDGNPIVAADGWAVVRYKFDPDRPDGWTEKAFYDARDRLVIGAGGYARRAIVFHPDGRSEDINCGTDNQPMFNPLKGYAIRKDDPRTRGSTVQSYHGPDGALITGPEGYAEWRERWSDGGAWLESAYFGPRGERVPGPYGFHRKTLQPGAAPETAEYDYSDDRFQGSQGSNEPIPLLYISEILGFQEPEAKIGLQAGDLPWSYGEWSFPDSLIREYKVGMKLAEIGAKITAALFAERDRLSNRSVPMMVLRNDRFVKFNMPPLPAKKFGMKIETRFVPESTYEAMKKIALAPATPPRPVTPGGKSR